MKSKMINIIHRIIWSRIGKIICCKSGIIIISSRSIENSYYAECHKCNMASERKNKEDENYHRGWALACLNMIEFGSVKNSSGIITHSPTTK